MARKDEFDDEGFFERLLKRKDGADLPPDLRRIFKVIAVLAVLTIFAALIFSAFSENENLSDGQALPLIRADNAPIREKPEDRGGMMVPNKDSTIFDTLKGERSEGGIENLLEEGGDTAAVAREEVASKVEKKTEPLVDVDLQSENNQKAEPVTAEKPKDEKTVESVIEALKEENKPDQEKVEAKPAPAPATEKPASIPAPAASGGTGYIQLAAVKSESEAAAQWAKFKAKNPELEGLSMRVQKADLGAKGVFYRIQAGPLSPEKSASTCSAIKSRGGNCLIVK